MDTNALIDVVHEVQGQLWVDKVNESHRMGCLCQWVSTFHVEKLSCHLDGPFHHGVFNAGMKIVFQDGTAWMVRFPHGGMVCDDYADEKVAMEVMALDLIYNKITIPVPRVWVWGLAASNLLGLDLFIIMDFIDGVSLSDLLQDPNTDCPTRVIKEDIRNTRYRTYLQALRISSLPLIFKAYSILQNDGVTEPKDLRQRLNTFNIRQDLMVIRLFSSAPCTWDYQGDKPPKIATRYFKYLDIFICILEEEEVRMPDYKERELSSLIKWLQASGAIWLYMLLSSSFNDYRSFSFTREKAFNHVEELEAFAERKMNELDKYDEALEKIEETKVLIDSGKMTKQEFIARALIGSGNGPAEDTSLPSP
ncbi:uncharacterized protein BO80DRAFT_456414 [Aspergillus ibericus CBS 121593]|uniref:Aminoglycoside phosphotransferase domain-containing protein n=1 Tax=Aspergillus ibericus CBS 121593 TaxID=1448316 RepID=A0A395GVV4_9EURO|nr:hypothetical protein BO80DRAFT_456414 [Aspergillus ibericus CBS 121593]RAK99711.1 hypothetical protein BO80DRAFT_456414 [Aspergillus ibericus CBS 121593]